MPRIGFVSAILFSIALIGGALWFRFVRIPPYLADMASLQRVEQLPSGDTLLEDFYNAGATLATTSSDQLTKAQSLGRGLFSDYIGLKSQGAVNSNSIKALATEYAEKMANFDLSIQKVSRDQIVVIPDSEINLTTYGNTMGNIRNKYKNLVASQAQIAGKNIVDIGSPAFSTFMRATGKIYQASADELLVVKVPTSLVENHMNLINNYLVSSKIMESLGNVPGDPMQAYAALNIYVKNSGEESNLLLNIQKVMLANGIIFNSII